MLNISRKIIVNLVFFTVLLIIILVLTSDKKTIHVPNGSALVLNLKGDIVEQKFEVDPIDTLLNEAFSQKEERPEVLLADIIKVIEQASNDDRISLLVLQLGNVRSAGLTKLQDIGSALTAFKASGKNVIAIGDYYSQEQYYLASYADNIWLNPRGYMLLDGYGRYGLYFKSALEKLSISQHIFKVGTYKSAVEPYSRDDMSDAAKEANKLWLNDLWQQYKQDVANQRGFGTDNFDETFDSLLSKFKLTKGNFAEYALNNKWVDQLKTRDQMVATLVEQVGENYHGDSFKQINFNDYLTAIDETESFDTSLISGDKVAIVVAKGAILDGRQKPGQVGGDSTANLLKKARLDDKVKAVVLRVDSPGGSAYASEIIRQEIELIKAAGKPVVASMGTVAASGGYWISASADQIVAAPTTITGSIGIFGMFMTVENTLAEVGVYTDGVGTTELSGFGITRPLSTGMADLIQLNIERGYRDFLTIVADNRNMTIEQVDNVAQGRVWSGVKAKELGLVDQLGTLNDAIEIAANLAEITHYQPIVIEQELSPRDKFLQNLFGNAAVNYVLAVSQPDSALLSKANSGPITQLVNQLSQQVEKLDQFNDPQGIYSFCLSCNEL